MELLSHRQQHDVTTDDGLPHHLAEVKNKILHLIEHPEEIYLKTLRHVEKNILEAVTADLNQVVSSISTTNLMETNTLLKAVAHVAQEELGEKMLLQKTFTSADPRWKRRI